MTDSQAQATQQRTQQLYEELLKIFPEDVAMDRARLMMAEELPEQTIPTFP